MDVSIRAQEYAIKKTEKYIPESYGDMRHRRVAERFDSYDIEQAYQDGAQEALASQWVSVEDALPDDDQQVIASFLDGGISLGYYDYSDCLWFIDGLGAYNKYEISHWMPIPIPQLNPEKE